MNTNFIFIPTEDHQMLGRKGQWMCIHCCRFVEFSALGFSSHIKFCKPYKQYSVPVVPQRNEVPVTPIQFFQ